eukprot:362779-Chlamydomonas_euryale.AAC.6
MHASCEHARVVLALHLSGRVNSLGLNLVRHACGVLQGALLLDASELQMGRHAAPFLARIGQLLPQLPQLRATLQQLCMRLL